MKSGYGPGHATSQSSSVSVNASELNEDDRHWKARKLSCDLQLETEADATIPYANDIE